MNNQNNYLGMTWEVINPAIQILVYWFVFQTIRQRADVELITGDAIPYILWMVSGFILWHFFYRSTIDGSRSIYSRLLVLSKMNFPMSVIPSFVIFSNFYIYLILLFLLIILLNIIGYFATIYYIQIIYFVFATFCLIYSISLITSTLSTIVRDVHMLLNSVLRMFLYLTPILWVMDELPYPVSLIMKLNPLYYLVEGIRAGLFGTEWYFLTNWEYTLYFWAFVLTLFLIGSALHVKFRRHLIDFL